MDIKNYDELTTMEIDTLREIGSEARRDMEKLTGEHIHLQIWVKVRPGWRDNADDLKTLGYTMKN